MNSPLPRMTGWTSPSMASVPSAMLSAINPKLKPAIDTICEQIASLNPIHGKRLKKNLPSFDERYHRLAEAFFERYAAILHREKKSLDYAIGCYLQMVA